MRICYNITMNFDILFRDIPLRIKNKTENVVKQTRFFFRWKMRVHVSFAKL